MAGSDNSSDFELLVLLLSLAVAVVVPIALLILALLSSRVTVLLSSSAFCCPVCLVLGLTGVRASPTAVFLARVEGTTGPICLVFALAADLAWNSLFSSTVLHTS